MTLWFGRPGAVVAFPDPAPGVDAPLERPAAEHRTLGGGRVVDYSGPGRRVFRLRWERLTDTEYATIEAFHAGSHGPGPWLLLPGAAAWNYLTANQASATDATGDTTGFTTTGAGTAITSTQTDAVIGRRVLGWTLPATPPGDARIVLAAQHALPGVPVVPGVPVTFSAQARSDTALDLALALGWRDRDGDPTPETVAAPAPLRGDWTPHLLTATPPEAAAYVVPMVTVRPATPTTTGTHRSASSTVARSGLNAASIPPDTVQLDAFRLDLRTDLPPGAPPSAARWRPGRGVPRVAFTDLSDVYAWADSHDAEATFLEVV